MTGTRARRWLPSHDEATRDFHARYAPSAAPPFWPVLREAAEAMPRTARVLVIAAALLVVWPLVLMVTQ